MHRCMLTTTELPCTRCQRWGISPTSACNRDTRVDLTCTHDSVCALLLHACSDVLFTLERASCTGRCCVLNPLSLSVNLRSQEPKAMATQTIQRHSIRQLLQRGHPVAVAACQFHRQHQMGDMLSREQFFFLSASPSSARPPASPLHPGAIPRLTTQTARVDLGFLPGQRQLRPKEILCRHCFTCFLAALFEDFSFCA